MRTRRSRAVSLLVTSIVVTGVLLPATAGSRSGAADPVTAAGVGMGAGTGPGTGAGTGSGAGSGAAGSGAGGRGVPVGPADPVGPAARAAAPDTATVSVADLPVEPPARPARGAPQELFGADCSTRIEGSQVKAYCHNRFTETDLVRLHVECDRWWDVDGDGAPLALGPAGRAELSGRCWKEVRSAWVSHQRP
ncbi:hypothetical protein ACIBEA_08535 [Streptomyces sp. NPDC051555]|uniref:hypothetical protein n=1 Tax=Streptomyces sp. NPDC051555 TaxID=3365657 RepID=UPI0037B8A643